MIPYGKQSIDQDDIESVVETLKSDFLTTGPKVEEFEKSICDFTNAKYAVAVSNGTAALHAAMFAIGIKKDDEVIVSSMTFAASANAILYQNGTPVFADVLENNLLIDPKDVEKKITSKTKAIIAVDYAGQSCDYNELNRIAKKYNLILISDACHSIGGAYHDKMVGSLADITCLSFHPVKHITTGEGGMSLTNNAEFAEKMKVFRNHGITTDFRQREEKGAWFYDMEFLGYNYRITDIQCALGISQLKKLPKWIQRRQKIAKKYDIAFADNNNITSLKNAGNVSNAFHLYIIQLDDTIDRNNLFQKLRSHGIGINIHYKPVYLHSYYKNLGYKKGICPVAESAYEKIISLPMFPTLTDEQQNEVIEKISNFTTN